MLVAHTTLLEISCRGSNGSLMKVENIAECSPLEHSAILLICFQRYMIGLKTNFRSFREWPRFYTGFAVGVVFRKIFFFSIQKVKEIPLISGSYILWVGHVDICRRLNKRIPLH